MITLEDIARQAGVSHSTVSRALAGSRLVNAETKARIQALALEAGYQVNQVARNLKARSTRMIGLIVPEESNPYYPKVIQKIADEVHKAGYSLQLHLSGAEQESELACVALLREHRADGILLITAEHGLVARDLIDSLVNAGNPLVIMGWVDDADHMHLVTGDDASGGYELANHLVHLGHRRIAILGKSPHRGAYDRMAGFKTALEEAGIELPSEYILSATNETEVRSGVARLLRLDEPPTAIFAYQDSLAALVYKYLSDANVSIPNDMTVVGFDDLELATYLSPQLTTVGTHIEPLASEFVRLLIDQIQDVLGSRQPCHVVVTPKLVVRGSSAPPRREQDLVIKEIKH